MARDEILRQWGENIRTQRALLTPSGGLRMSGADREMTQADLGSLLSPPVGQSTVARWEHGLMEPRRSYKSQLAELLHLDVRMLFPLTRSATRSIA